MLRSPQITEEDFTDDCAVEEIAPNPLHKLTEGAVLGSGVPFDGKKRTRRTL